MLTKHSDFHEMQLSLTGKIYDSESSSGGAGSINAKTIAIVAALVKVILGSISPSSHPYISIPSFIFKSHFPPNFPPLLPLTPSPISPSSTPSNSTPSSTATPYSSVSWGSFALVSRPFDPSDDHLHPQQKD